MSVPPAQPAHSDPLLAVIGSGSRLLAPQAYGGKAANLAWMARLGMPVPPAFALHIRLCREYLAAGGRPPEQLGGLLRQGVAHLEQASRRGYGAIRRPLLLSVRSGAALSMPGMLATVLNVGLNPETLRGLVMMTGQPRFAWNTYARFVAQFGEVVSGHDPAAYRSILRDPARDGAPGEGEARDFRAWKQAAEQCLACYADLEGEAFPCEPLRQLEMAVEAVFRSWNSARAREYRQMSGQRLVAGTGVTVQAMVFGNAGLRSGSGVAFTRDPSTGEERFLVDFVRQGQGEDVVAGEQCMGRGPALAALLPVAAMDLEALGRRLEREYGDMLDIEFTVEDEQLFLLQCRRGKRSPLAALRIAVEMARQGIVTRAQARDLLAGVAVDEIRVVALCGSGSAVGQGVGASPGVVTGRIVLNPETLAAEDWGQDAILVRECMSPDDVGFLRLCVGIVAAAGSRTAHAAVVARGLGKVCVVSCTGLQIDAANRRCSLGGHVLVEGDVVTVDGSSGIIYAGRLEVETRRPDELLAELHSWEGGDAAE